MDVRYCAYIFNLIACDVLKDFHQLISKIRYVVKFVISSPARYSCFEKCVKEENISSNSVLCFDVPTLPTRLDSTYLMLKEAKKFEKAFQKLKIHDLANVNEDIPSSKDWEVVRSLVHCLSLFYETNLKNFWFASCSFKWDLSWDSLYQNFIKIHSLSNDNLVLNDIARKCKLNMINCPCSWPLFQDEIFALLL